MNQLKQLRTQALARWRALDTRERRLVMATGVLLGIALLWWIGLQPALRTLREAPPRLAALDDQLQQMNRWAAEARTLQGLPTVSPAQAERALQAAAERLGSKARLNLQGDRAVLNLQGVPGEDLWGWFIEIRTAARARPVEAQLSRNGDTYTGTVTVLLPGGAP